MKFVWFFIVASFLFLSGSTEEGGNEAVKYESGIPVEVSLTSKWNETPLLLEGFEALSSFDQHRDSVFWKAAETLPVMNAEETAQKSFETFMKVAEEAVESSYEDKALSALKMGDLRLSLALRRYSAAVSAFTALWPEKKNTQNEFSVSIDGETIEDEETLVSAFDKRPETATSERLFEELDHFYGACKCPNYDSVEPSSRVAILYASLGTEGFKKAHSLLKSACESHKIDAYVLRHDWRSLMNDEKPGNGVLSPQGKDHKTDLPGFGVEFALKSVEYKVINDEASKKDGETQENKQETVTVTEGENDVIIGDKHLNRGNSFDALSESQLFDLPTRVMSFVQDSDDKLDALRLISQNFPAVAEALSKKEYNSTLLSQIFPRLQGEQGVNSLTVNGRIVSSSEQDVYSLFDIVSEEMDRVALIMKEHVSRSSALDLVRIVPQRDYGLQKPLTRFTLNGDGVLWVNDLENDARTRSWPKDLSSYDTTPNHYVPRRIRRNLVSAVFIVDPLDGQSLMLVNSLLWHVYQRSFPIRVGVVFNATKETQTCNAEGICETKESPAFYVPRAFRYIQDLGGRAFASGFFWNCARAFPGDRSRVTMDHLKKVFVEMIEETQYRKKAQEMWDDMLQDKRHDKLIQHSAELAQKFSGGVTPRLFINGVPLKGEISISDVYSAVLTTHFEDISEKIREGKIKDSTKDIYSTLVDKKQPNVFSDFSSLAFSSESSNKFVDFLSSGYPRDAVDSTRFFVSTVKSSEKVSLFSTVVATDFSTKSGRDLALAVLQDVYNNALCRVAFFDSAPSNEESANIWAQLYEVARKNDIKKAMSILSKGKTKYIKNGEQLITKYATEHIAQSKFVSLEKTELSVPDSTSFVIINGHVFSIAENETFASKDIEIIRSVEEPRARVVVEALNKIELDTANSDPDMFDNEFFTNLAMRMLSYYGRDASLGHIRIKDNSNDPEKPSYNNNFVVGDKKNAYAVIDFTVDPLSKTAQRVVPRLQALLKHLPLQLNGRYSPIAIPKEVPKSISLKTFYVDSIPDSITFDEEGKLVAPKAIAKDLPATRLITLGMEVPFRWLVMASKAVLDMDNLRLDVAKSNGDTSVVAEYNLENIILEGSCFSLPILNPPNGLELELVPTNSQGKDTKSLSDTLVMQNEGYYQLKSVPGIWDLQIRHGKSDRLYVIRPHGKPFTPKERSDLIEETKKDADKAAEYSEKKTVVIRSMSGKEQPLIVQKRPGYESYNLLDNNPVFKPWTRQQIKFEDYVNEDDGKVHIYSVASGHLYERFAKIMVLSVVKQSSVPCKFWFIENYLSPHFKETIGDLAAAYNFEYEFVTYKWPAWLNEQNEKQRLIWGYKILFLDVLFPVSLKKVIYVDADQVVRTDMKELMDMDLQGASIGMTPFCSGDIMREETKGYRFWDQGFWLEHLNGRPYHISALYVVDLARFRRIGAGDIYRDTYNSLSRDPGSLANLDQDLPNYLQQFVRIHSLPRNWLWCESWCSNSSKAEAKTIDLCNNPLTKRPKLDAAKLFIEEWTDLDNEVHKTEEKSHEKK